MDRAVACALSHICNCTRRKIVIGVSARADTRETNMSASNFKKYRTAVLLGLFAFGLFLFTVLSGLH